MNKSAFVGIVGRPNVGKSTLLNGFLGEKIAITANKPQTTRNTIRGIYTDEMGDDKVQLVFLDTPGIHKGKNKLGKSMTEAAIRTFSEVDVLLFLVDSRIDRGPGDMNIVEMLKDIDTPKILVINKIDLMAPDDLKETFNTYEDMGIFESVVGISAIEGAGVPELLDEVMKLTKPGPLYFPDDMITDHPEKFIVSEIIREKALEFLDDEVPHGVAVEIESYRELDKLTRISAVIYCEKKSHKGIIIGKDGRKLKGIGKSARKDIEALVGTKVFLELWVKVKENWRDSDFMLSNFGYKE
ncbi:MAG: GTPase Era [Clostridiales bacterium]|nr:GTPase Era [Clostridiales bacterium]MDD7346994.1 GTPase Era [Clostridiales bacterium]MDY4060512.1 GTPase Era [Anaerovoracaceae bacterium]